ncbi:MAG: hypothetical protein D6806_19000 [Deltaproteobacteria bacterium]|nr:MAG: hypothetical protein D6806_19000 [Deltaproteobacteria bacterium]
MKLTRKSPGVAAIAVIAASVLGFPSPWHASAQQGQQPPQQQPGQQPDQAGGQQQEPQLSEEELKELAGEVEEEAAKVGPEVFDEGVKAFYDGDYVQACRRLWDYMSATSQGDKNYGYAEYFLAASFEKLGLTHAAVEYYYNVAKNRTRPELLPDALEALERITRKFPFDEDLVLKDLLYDTAFGFVRPELKDFVEYYQGLMDFRNGFVRWGRKHFSRLTKGGYYYYKSRYVLAVYELVRYNLDDALKIFRSILESDISHESQADVVNDTRQSIARIFFEQKKFKEAYEMYEKIDAPIEDQASVFMEEAWTLYYLKDYRRAMGLLYALEAPAFYRYFNPEKFLLKALIYKNLCHYNVAKDAVAEFRQYFGDAIDTIYDRIDLDRDQILLDAALQDSQLVSLSDFARLLDTELGALDDFAAAWEQNGLLAHLRRLYELKLSYINRKLNNRLDSALREVAEKLLEFEEQMNLLEYEIGLDIYKRIKGTPTRKQEEKQQIPKYGNDVYYEFDGEFWNDELHDFRFFIEDRCFGEERWE